LKQVLFFFYAALFAACFLSDVNAQNNITIKGKVTDAETGEPLPYVNIVVVGKFHGTSTDFDGNYTLDVRGKTDSIAASAVGYIALKKKVEQQPNQVIDFALKPESININEVVVNAGENPADILFKKMVSAKGQNNPANLKSFQYEGYTKYELDLDNVKPKDIDDNFLLKGFDFLKDYIDTISEKGKTILPIFFIEQISDNYFQNDPAKAMERVKGQKMTMLRESPLITELISNVNQNFNIYENLMNIMGKSMVSPIADYGLSVYKYHINELDTLYINGQRHFLMKFKPKRKGDFAFAGKMIVNIDNYAVQSIEATIPPDVNIGFVKDFLFVQEFYPYILKTENSDSTTVFYAPYKDNLKMNFSANVGKSAFLIAKKSKSYKNVIINEPIDEKKFDIYKTTVVEDSAYKRNDLFWDTIRHEKLQKSEAGIYEMVDSLKRTSKFKVIKYALSTIVGGYAKFGPIGIGNVANIFSRNQVEGWRIRLGFLTNRDLSERVQLGGYVAYGFSDQRVKYGGKMIFIISKKPWHKITLSGRTDIDFMSRHAEEMDQDNVFTLVQKRNVTQRLYNIEEGKIVYDNEFYKDMTSYLTLQYRTFQPYFPFLFQYEGADTRKVITSEIGYTIRWQHKSNNLPGVFDRDAKANQFFAQFRKKSTFPVVWTKYLLGVPKVGNSQFLYHDVSLGFQGNVTLTAKQYFYYNLWFGKIFGTLPFLLLKNPEGNFHHVHNKYLFNNMNLLEFSADQYTSLNFQYFLGGWIADHLPLIKKLKLRGVATTNIFYGTVSNANKNFNRNNNIGIAYPIPYVEAGFGIENILKFIRIDCIWRVTQRDRPQAYKFGVYASLFIKV
jgi:hypothetical protein